MKMARSKRITVTDKPTIRKITKSQRKPSGDRVFTDIQDALAYFFPQSKDSKKPPYDGKKAGTTTAEKRLAELEHSFLP